MSGLRWTLGIVTTLFLAGWVVLVAAGDSFRASLGASANGPLKVIVPVAGGALLLASLVMPERRILLHVTAIAVVALIGASLWIARETTFVAGLGMAYAVGWLVFYYLAAWRANGGTAAPPP